MQRASLRTYEWLSPKISAIRPWREVLATVADIVGLLIWLGLIPITLLNLNEFRYIILLMLAASVVWVLACIPVQSHSHQSSIILRRISAGAILLIPIITFLLIAFSTWNLIVASLPVNHIYKLCFNRNFDIYTSNDDGSTMSLVAPYGGSCSWSLDGTAIVFDSTRNGYSQIFEVNADGTYPRLLTNGAFKESLPIWSPDGTKIAYEASGDIFVINVDGSSQQKLTNNPTQDTLPAWSPDGKQIAYVSGKDNDAEIYIMIADGSNQRRLTYNLAEDAFPDWSPDGRRIVFASKRDGFAQVYVMNVDGSDVKRLTDPSTGVNDYPVWSPDGTKIAFDSSRDGNWSVYIMNSDGLEQKRLTPDDGLPYFAPSWRPVPGY